ncbi:MAG TPA: cell wall-binding repeat-containing protein [Solirubrobacteraceae bacterium]|nr:cell wall-binding repeat-containing protein [Solirubrobacteraceae bacterium]
MRFALLPATLCALMLLLGGCGGGGEPDRAGAPAEDAPALGREGDDEAAATELGFPAFATSNTTRVGGADPIADAAAIAQAVFPSRDRDTRPRVLSLVDAADWRVAVSAAQLMAGPLRAPLLFSERGELPAATEQALGRLIPAGAKEAGGAQVVRIGQAAVAEGYKTTEVEGADHAALAQAIDRLQIAAAGKPSPAVVVASSEEPGFAMPAAAWAAKSGQPVLWVTRDAIPAATRAAITAHKRPKIYVLGPESAVSKKLLNQLSDLGAARRVSGADPVANAIAFARFSDGSFGWNVVDPGHGLVFASTQRPLDAAAAAPLSASGTYGPLLLLTAANALPAPVQDYLLDIQPGYDEDPVRGVYNHGWMIGDEGAIAVDVQARIDALLEIQAVDRGDGA